MHMYFTLHNLHFDRSHDYIFGNFHNLSMAAILNFSILPLQSGLSECQHSFLDSAPKNGLLGLLAIEKYVGIFYKEMPVQL